MAEQDQNKIGVPEELLPEEVIPDEQQEGKQFVAKGIKWSHASPNSVDPGHKHTDTSVEIGRALQVVVFASLDTVTTGDGKIYLHIDSRINGMDLVDVHAYLVTAGITGTTDIQIHNLTDAVDMLSTKLTIDSTEKGSDTAAIPAVIDTTKDDVVTNDVLRIDIDAVQTTAPKGLIITLGFKTP